MAEKYKPVVFNEGAPLDPQKLNDLQTNITSLLGDVSSLQNSTGQSTYTVVTDVGTYMTESLKVGTPDEYEVPFSSAFSTGVVPKIIASIGSSVTKDQIVTVSVTASTTKPRIQVWTNKDRGPVRVNWIAFEKK